MNCIKDRSVRAKNPGGFRGIKRIVSEQNVLTSEYGLANVGIDRTKIWVELETG